VDPTPGVDSPLRIGLQIRPTGASRTGSAGSAALLERESELIRLEQCLDKATAAAAGRAVFVGGEAGVGKTSLLDEFVRNVESSVAVLRADCLPLLAPRPLGPFFDLSEQLNGRLVATAGSTPHAVATALLSEIADTGPTLVVVEDAHWADEGTLDVLRLMVARLGTVDALLVVSYRDDELGPWHPTRVLIGELGARYPITRVRLAALSQEAVAMLAADSDTDADELYRRTGGNPFFVTELLAADIGLPATVSDAVLARVARAPRATRELLEACAVVGPNAESWVLERIIDGCGPALDDALSRGLLVSTGEVVRFRHELAREAILSTVGEHRRTTLHRAALGALRSPPGGEPELARLAHHAIGAADADEVLRIVPEAAARASNLGAHREAAVLYGQATRFAGGAPLTAQAELFERLSFEHYFFTDFAAAEAAQRQALACYQKLGDEHRQGAGLTWLAQLTWEVGSLPAALESARRAVAKLENLPPSPELMSACSMMAGLMLAAEDPDRAREWSGRAMLLAPEHGRERGTQNTEMTAAWVDYFGGDQSGLERLERCVTQAEKRGRYSDVIVAHVVIARTAARLRMYETAAEHVRLGLEYCDGRDFDVWRYYLIGWQAKIALAEGRWQEAAELSQVILNEPCPFSRIHALVALALVRARRGDPDPWSLLDEALTSALPRHELQWMGPVAAARAETAWLEGRPEAIATELEHVLEFPRRRGDPYTATLAYWAWRGGTPFDVPPGDDSDPHLLEARGDWRAAAARWRGLGCPYEAALALSAAEDEETLLQSYEEMLALGAGPAASMVARRLRKRGMRRLPRGPRSQTQENPGGLTARELEVLALLSQGLRNAAIAQRLVISEKTVDHHVSAILRKLDVRSRTEACFAAGRLGITA
jgi:DNA-binding CsgD family transcriptional regulator